MDADVWVGASGGAGGGGIIDGGGGDIICVVRDAVLRWARILIAATQFLAIRLCWVGVKGVVLGKREGSGVLVLADGRE